MPIQEVNWDKFEFRSHYFGELMTKPRGKSNLEKYNEAYDKYIEIGKKIDGMKDGSAKDNAISKALKLQTDVEKLKPLKDKPNLSDTCKKRLAQIYTEQTTGRIKEIESIYLEKGLKTEEDSITLYSLATGLYYRKNKERLSNGWVTGEIDFDDEVRDMTIDAKGSFDIFTFDETVAKKLNPIYEWQGQCYMWLKNRKNHRIAYCLNNTPLEIIHRMEMRMRNNFMGTQTDFDEACYLLQQKHTYDDLPIERKIRIYDIKRDDEKIDLAKQYIPYFRDYLKNFEANKNSIYVSTESSSNSQSDNDSEEG